MPADADGLRTHPAGAIEITPSVALLTLQTYDVSL